MNDKSGCCSCEFFLQEGPIQGDYGWVECTKKGNERMQNLKSFPFKNSPKCFQLSFWLSEFAGLIKSEKDHDDMTIWERYREKYATR